MIKKVAKKPVKKTKTTYIVLMESGYKDVEVIIPTHYGLGTPGMDSIEEAMKALHDMCDEDPAWFSSECTFSIAAVTTDTITAKALPLECELVVTKGD